MFWLGRYTERVYTALHLVRKCLDAMIDENENAYVNYCEKMGVPNVYSSPEDFAVRYLYDAQNPNSLNATLRSAYDNAIELREEIMSESLSYVQLSVAQMEKCATVHPKVGELQCITDYLLAFWGSVDERVFDRPVKALLNMGKWLECMELHLRFDYPPETLSEIYAALRLWVEQLDSVYDREMLDTLDALMNEFPEHADTAHRMAVLSCLNSLFAA